MAVPDDIQLHQDPTGRRIHNQNDVNPRQYKFSEEELRVLRECNRESFYYRSLPMSALGAFITHYAVKQGYIRGNPRWGSSFKVGGAAFLGWVLGKISYRKTCEEKLLRLPNSQFSAMLRRRTGGYSEMLTTEIPTGSLEKDQSSSVLNTNNEDLSNSRTLDLNSDKLVRNVGLDDRERPSLDSFEGLKEDESSFPTQNTTYEELRHKNREDFDKRQTVRGNSYFNSPTSSGGANEQQPKYKGTSEAKNQYGDSWEE